MTVTLERRTSRRLPDGLAVAVFLLAVAGGSLIVPAAPSGALAGGKAPPVTSPGRVAIDVGLPGTGRADPAAGPARPTAGCLE